MPAAPAPHPARVPSVSRRSALVVAATAAFVAGSADRPVVAAEAPFELRDGDRVVFVGEEFTEQRIKHNFLEAALVAKWPDRSLVFRNLGWSGDMPDGAARGYFNGAKEGYARLTEELQRLKPTVVFVEYGAVAAYDPPAKDDDFVRQTARLVDDLKKLTDRLVLVSPIPAERRAPPLPNPDAINARRREIAARLRGLAQEKGLRFVDLFGPLDERMRSARAPLTHDTIRPNADGYRVADETLLAALGIAAPTLPAERDRALRGLIAEKNDLYFHRYRPQNETYLRGFRKKEQGQNAKEIAEFDALIERVEARIAALVQGKPLPESPPAPPAKVLAFEAADPEEERKTFATAPGLAVSLFAAEPLVANPIHMQFDGRGRLWVASSPIYPQILPGAKATDEIVVLEDTDGDGRADRRTVFANDLLIPTAVLPDEAGGAYVANSTELLHLADEDGNGRADRRRVVLSGFGTEDTHHILHTFRWGPDAALWFHQSIYIHTHAETPFGIRRLMGSGTWRLRTATGQADVFARGLVNPWGLVFDDRGRSFATDGAGGEGIDYFFPGAAYVSAVGAKRILKGLNPGSPKFCGLEIVSGRHFPDDWQGTLLTNDFRGNRIARFQLSEQGSGFVSRRVEDFLSSTHRAFRPVDLKLGPDGALYVADWYNPIINHGEVDFRDPRRDDRHGRIWRVTHAGRKTVEPPKIDGAETGALIDLLAAPEQRTRLLARVHLARRGAEAVVGPLAKWTAARDAKDPQGEAQRLEALWTYQALDRVEPELLRSLLAANDARVRAAAVRVLADWHRRVPDAAGLLETAVVDRHPLVRLEAVCTARAFASARAAEIATRALEQEVDPWLDYSLWLTLRELEPQWFESFLAGRTTFGGEARRIVFALKSVEKPQTARPLLDRLQAGAIDKPNRPDVLALIADFGQPAESAEILDLALKSADDRTAALEALLAAARRGRPRPSGDLARISALTDADAAVELAGWWKVDSLRLPVAEIASAAGTKEPLRSAAIRALGAYGDAETLRRLAGAGRDVATRRAAVAALAGFDRKGAAQAGADVLAACQARDEAEAVAVLDAFLVWQDGPDSLAAALRSAKLVEPVASAGVRRAAAEGSRADGLVAALRTAGSLTDAPRTMSREELLAFAKVVETQGDAARGERIFRRKDLACFACHAIAGGGGRVGPDLVSLGAGAPTDYIVESLVAPSAKIKEGYHTLTVVTQSGRVYNGTIVRQNPDEVALRDAENRIVSIAAADIEDKAVGTKSLMPAELVSKLTRDELVDLSAFLASLGRSGAYKAPSGRLVRRWRTADGSVRFSRTDGALPSEDRGERATFAVQVTTAGRVGLAVEGLDGAKLERGSEAVVATVGRVVLDLPVGRHEFVAVGRGTGAALRVEVVDVEGSAGRAEPVNEP